MFIASLNTDAMLVNRAVTQNNVLALIKTAWGEARWQLKYLPHEGKQRDQAFCTGPDYIRSREVTWESRTIIKKQSQQV